jgi:serine/threonine protein phosphatase PrpC
VLRIVDQAAASDVGRVRKANEDSYFASAPLFVVADGMGGAQAGEVASKIAADSFKTPLDETVAPEPRMANVVRAANLEIHRQSVSDPELQGMGTTLTALLLGDDEVTIAHVGDSRAYRLREGELERLTRDHSLVGEMVRRGAITEAEAEVHPQRSILTRALGPEAEIEVDTLSHSVRDGDIYLLCSDGLTGMASEATIQELLASGRPLKEIAEDLIRRANEQGGVDNITAILLKVAGGRPPAPPSTEPTDDDGATIIAPAVVVGEDATKEHDAAETTRPAQTPAAGGNGHVPPREQQARVAQARRDQTQRSRRWVGGVIAAFVILIGVAGAVVASLNVYFLGVNDKGLVTVYRGLPYDLPLSVSLYTRDYVTTEPASDLTPQQRARLLDHKLRTHDDALDLAGRLERGEIAGDAGDVDQTGASGAQQEESGGATAP